MSKKKNNGEVFTPQNIIDYMLNLTYKPEKMDYVLEPGCGDGRFILSILKKLIEFYGDDFEKINSKISKIYGLELDKDNFNKSKENVENFLKNYKRITERPKIFNCDALLNDVINSIKFCYIIGNPPYIRIHNLKDEYKEILKKEYEFLRNGMVDLYYGFFELYKKCLKDDGVLCYITPNSFLYNNSAECLVQTMFSDRTIKTILDFKSEKMFENASTYTAITVIEKGEKQFNYSILDQNFKESNNISIDYNNTNFNFLKELQVGKSGKTFSELFKVKTGIATLADKIFVINEYETNDGLITFTKNKVNYTIEESLTKKSVKASKFNGSFGRVIFPYKKIGSKNVPITEDELRQNYPLGYDYLFANKVNLLKRDKGKTDEKKWFLWGRTQGINNADGKKIIISPLFIDSPFKFIDEEVVVYSGYYILSETQNEILKSENFISSLKKISKSIGAGWFSLQKKILENVIIEFDSEIIK
jgi:adenine-specific DNA-methyltransferase